MRQQLLIFLTWGSNPSEYSRFGSCSSISTKDLEKISQTILIKIRTIIKNKFRTTYNNPRDLSQIYNKKNRRYWLKSHKILTYLTHSNKFITQLFIFQYLNIIYSEIKHMNKNKRQRQSKQKSKRTYSDFTLCLRNKPKRQNILIQVKEQILQTEHTLSARDVGEKERRTGWRQTQFHHQASTEYIKLTQAEKRIRTKRRKDQIDTSREA